MASFVTYTLDLFNGSNVTGGNKRFKELIWSVAELGDSIHLFLPYESAFPEHENIHRHYIKKPKFKFLPAGFLSFFLNFKKLRTIRKMNYDKVILVSVPYGIQGAVLGLPKITLILWDDFIVCRKMLSRQKKFKRLYALILPILLFIENTALKKAEQIIVQCLYDKKQIVKRHKKLSKAIENKTHILHNDVNPLWIKEYKNLIPKENTAVVKSPANIFFIGNMNDERKGLHLLLEAAIKLLSNRYNIRLKIIGSGKLFPFYQEQYSGFEEIEFLGYVSDPVIKLAEADLLVVPSLVDSFPNTIMEGLFLEIPVIGSRRGGIPEMLQYEELLFEPEEEALFTKIAGMIDENLFESYRQLCVHRKNALTFDWGVEMKKLLKS